MSRERIEEMAKVLEITERKKMDSHCDLPSVEEYAAAIYNAGYRKQSVGEWVEHGNWAGAIEYKCTACKETTFHAEHYAYCPNCGAKMKGGAE